MENEYGWDDFVKEAEGMGRSKIQLFHLHLIDVVWGHCFEDESVPSTDVAERLIEKAGSTFDETEVR